MSDHDLIRRGDALRIVDEDATAAFAYGQIRALPAVSPGVKPKVAAAIRQAMAAWQMAYNEPDRDELAKEEADSISAQWFAKWMKSNYPSSDQDAQHSGDCTKKPWSCLRCIADDAFASVDAALAAFEKEGRA